MYCSKGTPTFNRPQTFNFIAKLNGLDRPPTEAQGAPFNFISRLKRGPVCGCGRANQTFNLQIKLKAAVLLPLPCPALPCLGLSRSAQVCL